MLQELFSSLKNEIMNKYQYYILLLIAFYIRWYLFIKHEAKRLKKRRTIKLKDDIHNQLEVIMDDVKPISYKDCADAMLKMWMDGVLTDGGYNRIMDKLNKAQRKKINELTQEDGD